MRSFHLPRRRVGLLLAGLAGILVLGSPAMASAQTDASAEHITISHYSYAPASVSVASGTTVTWTNLDTVAHDVTVTRGPALFHSPMLSKGQSWSFTFTLSGPYSYICSVHPDMHGSVTVAAAAPIASAGGATGPGAGSTATTAMPATAVATPPASTISPFLFVGGGACAVLMFALLMLADRPRASVAPGSETTEPHDTLVLPAQPR